MALTPDQELELLYLAEAENEASVPQQPPADKTKLAMDMAMEKVPPQFKTAIDTYQAIEKLFDKGGEAVAESLAGAGVKPTTIPGVPVLPAKQGEQSIKTSPEVAAAVGTGIAMVPDIAASIPTGTATAKGASSAVRSLREGVGYSGEKTMERIGVRKAEEAIKFNTKKEQLEKMSEIAGKGIGEAEKAMGIQLKNTSSKQLATMTKPANLPKFADRAVRLSEKSAEELAKIASPEQLQFWRKATEKGAKAAGSEKMFDVQTKLYQANNKFSEALAFKDKGFSTAMTKYKEIQKAIDSLPKEFKKQALSLEKQLKEAEKLAKDQARNRKLAGGTALTAGVALAGRKAVNVVTGGN